MTDLRKAADLALQALDVWEDGLTDPAANFGWRFTWIGKEAQEALRQALAQPEQELKHFLSVGTKSIQSRVYDGETNELISFVKMPLSEAGLVKEKNT